MVRESTAAAPAPSWQWLKPSQRRQESTWQCMGSFTYGVLLLSCAICLPCTLFGALAWAVLPYYAECRHDGSFPHALAILVLPCVGTFLAAPGALWLVFHGRAATWHLRLAAIYAMLNWLVQIVQLQAEFNWCMIWTSFRHWLQGSGITVRAFSVAWTAVLGGTVFCGCRLTILRVRALEQACLLNLRARQLDWCFVTAMLLVVGLAASMWLRQAMASVLLLLLLLPPIAVATVLVLRAQRKGMRLARAAMGHAPAGRSVQVRQMHRALRGELICTVLMAASSAATILVLLERSLFKFMGEEQELWMLLLQKSLSLLDALCNEWYALHLSGAASGALRGSQERAAAAKERRQRRRRAKARWTARWQGSKEPQAALWDEKVCELAGRGISLEVLLAFFRRLPTLMESFDPARHSTKDVVRGAIIPFSAAERAACATVLMGDKFTLPDKMVAAIVADALGENDFSMISALLMADLERLERWVATARVGGRTYWVCAFAVNQHAVCARVRPDAKDTVTGLPPKECPCGLAKALNDTEPLLRDGRSIPCEMNKFDDMMKFLSARNPTFEQVLAIDAGFGLFSRTWCVAEIAAASEMGMAQRLKIHSQEALAQHAERLRGLRIQEMEASRAEDKQAILEGISDLDAFNGRLQSLLFEDLFPAWTSLDAEERMASAGAVIRWLPVWAKAQPQPASSVTGVVPGCL